MVTAPRVSPGTFRQLGLINWMFCRVASRLLGVSDMHVFSTLGHTGGLFRAWCHFAGRLTPFGVLSRRDSELVIIRLAHLRDSAYEMDHHRRLGRKAGFDDAAIQRIIDGPDAGWDDRDRTILTAVDELVRTRDVSDETWSGLAHHYTVKQQVAFMLLFGQYDSLATILGTLRVQLDR